MKNIVIQTKYNGKIFSSYPSGRHFHDAKQFGGPNVITICFEIYQDGTGVTNQLECVPFWMGISNIEGKVKGCNWVKMLLGMLPHGVSVEQFVHYLAEDIRENLEPEMRKVRFRQKIHPVYLACSHYWTFSGSRCHGCRQ